MTKDEQFEMDHALFEAGLEEGYALAIRIHNGKLANYFGGIDADGIFEKFSARQALDIELFCESKKRIKEKTIKSNEYSEHEKREKAECSLLSAMMINKDVEEVFKIVKPGDFSNGRYEKIFTAMKNVHEHGLDIEPLTVLDEMERCGYPISYHLLYKIVQSGYDSKNINTYAHMVKFYNRHDTPVEN